MFNLYYLLHKKALKGISNYLSNLRLFSRNARLFLIGTFFMGMGFSGFMLLFNLYLKEFGFAESHIGNIISASTLGTLLMAIPASILIRRIPIKRLLILATPVTMLSAILQVTVPSYYLIIAFGFTAGMARVFSQVVAGPFFMRNSGDKERPYLFSLQFATMLVAGIIGNLCGGFLPEIIERTGAVPYLAYRYTLYIFAGLVLAALIPYFLIREKPVGKVERLKLLSGKLLLKLFTPNLIVGIGAGLSVPFLNLYFKEVFSSATRSIGFFYSLQQLLMITGLLIAPVLAERIGKIRTVAISQLLSIPFLIILGISRSLVIAVFAFLFRAALMNMGQPLFTNFAMEKVKPDEQPLTNALLTVAFTTGWGASASIGGILIEHLSYSVPFFVTSALYFIATMVLFVLFGRNNCK